MIPSCHPTLRPDFLASLTRRARNTKSNNWKWANIFRPVFGKFVKDTSLGLEALAENKIVEEKE